MEEQTPLACASCGAPLKGKFCYECGEKKLHPDHDFSIKHFLEETFESFAHLDSKVLRSFWLLFSKPGFLTAEFLAGRRVRYFKPIPLFIIAGVLFYLFLAKATAFYSNLGDMSRGFKQGNFISNTFHVDTESLFTQKATASGRNSDEFWKEMSVEAAHRSKTWLFLVVPVWGLCLWGLFYKRIRFAVPHLIYALHGFTFFVLFDMICLVFLRYILQVSQVGDNYSLFLAICFSIYNAIALRRVYGLGRFASILSGIAVMFLFLSILILFRQSITLWTLYSL